MDGFDEFVEAETPRLLGLAYALTGNPHDAWDLVQEALTRVGLRWRRLSAENPGGYARTTSVHLNLARARQGCREVVTDAVPERSAPVVLTATIDPWLLEALAGLIVGTVAPLDDRAALQEELAEAVGMPVMVVPEERVVEQPIDLVPAR